MRIAVIDYHKGNLKSVERALADAGAEPFVTDDAASLARADALVLPGVGAFADASSSLRAHGQMDAIRQRIAAGVPFLGICLGMHLLFEEGAEGSPQGDGRWPAGNAPGLAILPGIVGALPRVDETGRAYKVPHVGWNSIDLPGSTLRPASHCNQEARLGEGFESLLLKGIRPGEFFYFTHGYSVPDTPFTVALTQHAVAFPSVVAYRETTFGVQFHPEKSSDAGAALLRNFVQIAKGA